MSQTNQPGQSTPPAQAAPPAQQTQTGGGPSDQQEQADRQPATFEAWIATQDDSTKKLIDGHVAGLKVVLAEQKQRGADLAKQLKDAAKGLEAGSEARKALEDLQGKAAAAEKRAAFYEDAIKPEIDCSNPRLAFLAAIEIGAIDDKGRVHWDDLKREFPEMFKRKAPPGDAGAGTGAPPPGKHSMNEYIRAAAGKG